MNADPVDVPEVAGVDEHRINSGRPFGLRQRHGEVSRPEFVTLRETEIEERKKSSKATGGAEPDGHGLKSAPNILVMGMRPDNSGRNSADGSDKDVADNWKFGHLSFRPDFDRVKSRGFYPNDLPLLLSGELDLEGGHALLNPIDSNRSARRRRCHRDFGGVRSSGRPVARTLPKSP